jgi:hypothetical protein
MRFLLEPNGPLAQVVEQLAFNQRVAGSSPARLTSNCINYGYRNGSFFFRLQFHLQVPPDIPELGTPTNDEGSP